MKIQRYKSLLVIIVLILQIGFSTISTKQVFQTEEKLEVEKNHDVLETQLLTQNVNLLDNYTAINHWGYDGYIGKSQIFIEGDLAFIVKNLLFIYNISDPLNPVLLLKYKSPFGQIMKIKTKGTLLYIICKYFGVLILDISNPNEPEELGKCGEYWSSARFKDCFVYKNYCYLLTYSRELFIIDASDPMYPIPVGYYSFTEYIRAIYEYNGYCILYKTVYPDEIMTIYDLKNPVKLRKIKELNFGDDVLGYLTFSDEYMINRIWGNTLEIYELNLPNKIELVARINNIESYECYFSGDYIYNYYNYSLEIYNFKNYPNPTIVNEIELEDYAATLCYNNGIMYLVGGYLQILNLRNHFILEDYILLSDSYQAEFCFRIGSFSDTSYIITNRGLEIYNTSDILNIQKTGEYFLKDNYLQDPRNKIVNFFLWENVGYFDCFNYLYILNLTNPSSPSLIYKYNLESEFGDVRYSFDKLFIKNDIAYFITEYSIKIKDISNPSNPILIKAQQLDFRFFFEIFDDLAVITYYDNINEEFHFELWNATNPNSFAKMNELTSVYGFHGLNYANNILYIVYFNHLTLFDLTDPFSPINISRIYLNYTNYVDYGYHIEYYYYTDLVLSDNMIYISDNKDILVIDGSIKSNLSIVGRYQGGNNIIMDFEIWGDKILTYNLNSGFNIIGIDSDRDLLPDYLEKNKYQTNQFSYDSDSDSISDYFETQFGLNPLNDTDALEDYDHDSLTNIWEYFYNTDPFDSDTDRDGLNDDLEIFLQTNPNYCDTDGDALSDGLEYNIIGTDPLLGDTDGDTKDDFYEVANGNNPLIWSRWKLLFLGYLFPVYFVLICTSPWIIKRTKKYVKNLKVKIVEGFEENH